MAQGTIGVGFLGAGPVTQAIHLPTLATMRNRFHVERVMDVDLQVAAAVAEWCGARAGSDEAEVLDDPAVEVVAICSPNAFHARQAIAACQAGKRLILCEKPLAVSRGEAASIAGVARRTGTPIVVGTMHVYDPAYREARAAWVAAGEEARLVQSSIFLPGNDTFIDQATDQVRSTSAPPTAPEGEDEAVRRKRLIRAAILGLAIHNIPLIREVHPDVGRVEAACFVPPFGYAVSLSQAHRMVELRALMPGAWPPDWRLSVLGRAHELHVSFPPSYVLGGSARAEVASRGRTLAFEHPVNGYEAMWNHISDVVGGLTGPAIPLDTIADDLGFAVDLANLVEAAMAEAR